MNVIQLPETRNETILIQWKKCLFSENIFAFFENDMYPVFSNKMEDLMLPDDYVIQQNHFANGDVNENVYEVFGWSDVAQEHLYTGRLFAPKGIKLI